MNWCDMNDKRAILETPSSTSPMRPALPPPQRSAAPPPTAPPRSLRTPPPPHLPPPRPRCDRLPPQPRLRPRLPAWSQAVAANICPVSVAGRTGTAFHRRFPTGRAGPVSPRSYWPPGSACWPPGAACWLSGSACWPTGDGQSQLHPRRSAACPPPAVAVAHCCQGWAPRFTCRPLKAAPPRLLDGRRTASPHQLLIVPPPPAHHRLLFPSAGLACLPARRQPAACCRAATLPHPPPCDSWTPATVYALPCCPPAGPRRDAVACFPALSPRSGRTAAFSAWRQQRGPSHMTAAAPNSPFTASTTCTPRATRRPLPSAPGRGRRSSPSPAATAPPPFAGRGAPLRSRPHVPLLTRTVPRALPAPIARRGRHPSASLPQPPPALTVAEAAARLVPATAAAPPCGGLLRCGNLPLLLIFSFSRWRRRGACRRRSEDWWAILPSLSTSAPLHWQLRTLASAPVLSFLR